ncbi:MAG: hypothetical protein PHV74_07455 [Dehalococcoidia bacterium]|nr:hypothetical protein [Dehalococcoidia bacterium]
MDKEQAITALQKAMSIKDKAARHQQLQDILDAFERSLKSNTSGSQIQNDSFHTLSTPSSDAATNPLFRRGGQRAIPENLVSTIDNWHGIGWGYGAIAHFLRQEHGLSVDRTTIKNVLRRKGTYATG